jgi:hypothetical protein
LYNVVALLARTKLMIAQIKAGIVVKSPQQQPVSNKTAAEIDNIRAV